MTRTARTEKHYGHSNFFILQNMYPLYAERIPKWCPEHVVSDKEPQYSYNYEELFFNHCRN